MKKIIDSFLTTLALLTRLPVGTKHETDFSFTPVFIPVVGILVGALNVLVFVLLRGWIKDLYLVAIVVLVIQYLAFNIFHFDGFVDTLDGVLSFAPREKKLEILKDVHIGAFALFFGALYVICKVHLLSKTMEMGHEVLIYSIPILAYPVSGRLVAVLLSATLKPARQQGLGASVGQFTPLKTIAGIIVSALPFALAALLLSARFSVLQLSMFVPLAGAGVAFVFSFFVFGSVFKGVTGDGLGFGVEMGELLHLLACYLACPLFFTNTLFLS